MQTSVREIVDNYLAEVEKHLGTLCNEKKVEARLDLQDHIYSRFSSAGPMADPEAKICAILDKLGSPEEVALGFLPKPKPEEIIRRHRRRVILTAAVIVAVLGLGIVVWLRIFPPRAPGELTPEMRTAAATRLKNLFAKYGALHSFTAKLYFETRTFGGTYWQEYSVSHWKDQTVLRPNSSELPGITIADTQTTIYLPWLKQYTVVEYTELERVFFGKSIIVALLQKKLLPLQYAVAPEDVTEIVSSETTTVITFSGVYLNWGDARFSVLIDNEKEELLEVSVAKTYSDTEMLQGKSRTYCERMKYSQCNPDITDEQLLSGMPTDATYRSNLEWYLFPLQEVAKGACLIGQPAPPFAGVDIITNRQVSLSSYRGKNLILTTCPSWGPWSRTYLAALNTLYQRYRQYGLEIVNIAPDVEPAHTMQFLTMAGIKFPYLTLYSGWEDPILMRYDAYRKSNSTPEFVLINTEGKVIAVLSKYFSPVTDPLSLFVELVAKLLGDAITNKVEHEYCQELASLTTEQAILRMRQYYQRSDDFHGKFVLEQILERDPQCLKAKLELCSYYLDYGYTLGKPLAESCLTLTDTSPYPYLLLGDYFRLETKESERAFREYRRAAELDPEDWRVNQRLGDYYSGIGHSENAIRYYHRSLVKIPENNVLCGKLGEEYSNVSNLDQTGYYFERSVKDLTFLRGGLDVFVSYACRMIGWARSKQKRNEQTIHWLKRALAYDGHQESVLYELGTSLTFHSDDTDGAVAITRRLASDNTKGTYCHLYGCALNKAGQYREATAAFQETLRLDPTIETTYTNLGFAYEGLGETEAARQSFQQAIRQFPQCWLTRLAREHLQRLDLPQEP